MGELGVSKLMFQNRDMYLLSNYSGPGTRFCCYSTAKSCPNPFATP